MQFRTVGALACGVVVASLFAMGSQSPQGESKACRVGTFQRQAVLVAYYGSKTHEQRIKELMAQRDKAEAAGDRVKVEQIESEGAALQELAHQQLAGEAQLGNILEHLRPSWPAIAKEANVALVVEQTLYHGDGVELIDVTPLIVRQFEPAKTKPKP